MKAESNQTVSLWLAGQQAPPQYAALEADTGTDVCIVGAGIAGLLTAYLMTRAGLRVIVLEDGRIAGGETGRSTAHVTAALDDRYFRIESMHGEEGARLAAESHMAAINRTEALVREENIACDFERVDGYLFAPAGRSAEEHLERMQKELQALQRAGISDARLLQAAPVDFRATGPVLHFPRQAQFDPLAFCTGLARAITQRGGRICEGTHVQKIDGGSTVQVVTARGPMVSAAQAVACTNASISDFAITHLKQAPYRTYVVAGSVPRGSIPSGLYWDDAQPYHYVRVSAGPQADQLIVGGEDHKTGHDDDAPARFRALEEWTRARFPQVQKFEYHWSGQVVEPFDFLSFTGPTPSGSPNVYMHSGDSGNGITHGVMAGILLTDLVLGRDNRWAKVYDPKRITLRAAPEFIKENLDVVWQFKDYVRPGEVKEESEIPRGEGRLLRRGNKHVAAYRDDSGALHLRSAACTHLKCIVHWNSLEKSWDCPCHGSRFDPHGKVLNGPAVAPLDEV